MTTLTDTSPRVPQQSLPRSRRIPAWLSPIAVYLAVHAIGVVVLAAMTPTRKHCSTS